MGQIIVEFFAILLFLLIHPVVCVRQTFHAYRRNHWQELDMYNFRFNAKCLTCKEEFIHEHDWPWVL